MSDRAGLPWQENYYATEWRAVAKRAGVRVDGWSTDARASAISEVKKATGSVDAARKMAGHTSVKTTMGYVRNDDLPNNRKVAEVSAALSQ